VERAKYREILPTSGNLALLEQPLNAAAGNKPFNDKKDYYKKSKVPSTKALAKKRAWDLETIKARTQELTETFLKIWKRPHEGPEPLVPILAAAKKPGYYEGWENESSTPCSNAKSGKSGI
jgi:hypothetical protein